MEKIPIETISKWAKEIYNNGKPFATDWRKFFQESYIKKERICQKAFEDGKIDIQGNIITNQFKLW